MKKTVQISCTCHEKAKAKEIDNDQRIHGKKEKLAKKKILNRLTTWHEKKKIKAFEVIRNTKDYT